MKYGYRAPSIKKSVSARTTGKINRSINKATNPLYGKKGMGYINDPQKAIYNKVYNKTTKNPLDDETKINLIVGIVIVVTIVLLWIIVNTIL